MNWMKWNEKQKEKEKKNKRLRKHCTDRFGFILNKYKGRRRSK